MCLSAFWKPAQVVPGDVMRWKGEEREIYILLLSDSFQQCKHLLGFQANMTSAGVNFYRIPRRIESNEQEELMYRAGKF
jgi:hypothetical protein